MSKKRKDPATMTITEAKAEMARIETLRGAAWSKDEFRFEG